ncbi:hypothetical protein GCM10010298_15020 [Streptomyces microflavus]|nr:hypothetical protein GCM10010298_15020 [Streptomyces microflavus]
MEAAKPSWAFGAGATRAEKGLAYAVPLFGICALVVGGHGLVRAAPGSGGCSGTAGPWSERSSWTGRRSG